MQIEVMHLDPRLTNGTFNTPAYQTPGSAAIDLIACIDEPMEISAGSKAQLIPTGMAINIKDPNVAAMILPRSSTGHKRGLVLGNSVGLIDSDYQGQLFVSAWNRNSSTKNMGSSVVAEGYANSRIVIEPGERIAQLVFVPVIQVEQKVVESFSETTERGEGGFGSTGKKSTAKK